MKRSADTEGMQTIDALNCSPLKKALNSLIETEIPQAVSSPIEAKPENKLVARLSEILSQSEFMLREVGSVKFKLFCQSSATDLNLCARFLTEFCNRYQPLAKMKDENTKLSIVEVMNQMKGLSTPLISQLQNLRARWRIHLWLQQNQANVIWLKQRQAFYPALLAKIALTPHQFDVKKAAVKLPVVDIAWLINAQNPHQAICDPQNQTHVLNFSASLTAIDLMLSALRDQTNQSILEMLAFIQANASFFEALVNQQLRPSLYEYVESNVACENLFSDLLRDSFPLLSLLRETDHQSVIRHPQKVQFYQSVITTLLSGYLSERWYMLFKLAMIGSSASADETYLLTVLTWMEQNREILRCSMTQNNAWQRWLMQSKSHKAAIRTFSKTLLSTLGQAPTIDVRGLTKDYNGVLTQRVRKQAEEIIAKIKGTPDELKISKKIEQYSLNSLGFSKSSNGQIVVQKPFANAIECYQDAIAGLSQQDRTTEISCVECDFLLFEFLRYNSHIVTVIAKQLSVIDPIVQAYRADQLNILDQAVLLPLSPTEVKSSTEKLSNPPLALPLSPAPLNSPPENNALEGYKPKVRSVKKRPMRSLADDENALLVSTEFTI